MDTNVVLARFAPKDSLRPFAKKFFDSNGERIVSPLSLIEINAVLSRGDVEFETPGFLAGESEEKRMLALSEFFVEKLGLRVESFSITSRARISDSTLILPLEYSEALKRAGGLRLRTLDLLHVAYAGLIDGLRTRIDRFVTSDRGILGRAEAIQEQFRFRVVHPRDAGPA